MAVTLFFGKGRISEFPGAVDAEKGDDGLVRVLRYGPHPPAVESMAVFRATDVALAQVFRHGVLIGLIVGDRLSS